MADISVSQWRISKLRVTLNSDLISDSALSRAPLPYGFYRELGNIMLALIPGRIPPAIFDSEPFLFKNRRAE